MLRRFVRFPIGRRHGVRYMAKAAEVKNDETSDSTTTPPPPNPYGPDMLRTSLQVSIMDKPGALMPIVETIRDAGINILSLRSREGTDPQPGKYITMFMDLECHDSEKRYLDLAHKIVFDLAGVNFLHTINSFRTPAFPTCITDLDKVDQTTLGAGAELEDDPNDPHPGFRDQEYRERRKKIVEACFGYKTGMTIPKVEYSAKEIETWGAVYTRLMKNFSWGPCREYQYNFPLLIESCGYHQNNIPQLEDISNFLKNRTGFTIRPVSGLLSSRQFLEGLAFRVFHSTQYIRHHSKPFYTPEPDVCHELMGHVPLFADPTFADFSQVIGMASLGATDEDIKRLATNYWFTLEYGMCMQEGEVKCYGAGLLSSYGEMEYAMSREKVYDYVRELEPYEPWVAAQTEYPVTKYQPKYFVAESFRSAELLMKSFASSLRKPFTLEYNPYNANVRVRPISAEDILAGKLATVNVPSTRGKQ